MHPLNFVLNIRFIDDDNKCSRERVLLDLKHRKAIMVHIEHIFVLVTITLDRQSRFSHQPTNQPTNQTNEASKALAFIKSPSVPINLFPHRHTYIHL